ncbi:MAG: hypothetical protein JO242_23485, partial [Streptosporangiaceae bacterium]|nr:hypothetical protein [Streptosporangiaceae bacterium]
MFSKHRRWAAVAGPVALAAGLSLAPLGVSQARVTQPGTARAAAAPQAAARAAAHARALPVITVKMNGKTISVTGALRSGGARIAFRVTGEAAALPIFVRLDPGVTLARFFAVLPSAAADPNNLYGIAQISMSTQANKGSSSVQANMAPGRYVALDLGPSTPVPPFTTFVITRSKSPARLPAPGATISTIDFGFRGAAKVRDGELVRFANQGFLVHMVFGVQAPNLKTAQKIARLLLAGRDNQAQKLAIGSYTFDNGLS